MAGRRGLSPDWSSAIESDPPTSEDCAVLHPQVSGLLDLHLSLGVCSVSTSSYSVACPFPLVVMSFNVFQFIDHSLYGSTFVVLSGTF